jgi:hypothetical protein
MARRDCNTLTVNLDMHKCRKTYEVDSLLLDILEACHVVVP